MTALSRLTNHGEFCVKRADNAQPCALTANGNGFADFDVNFDEAASQRVSRDSAERTNSAPSRPSVQNLERASSSSPPELPISKAALRGRFPGLSEIKISPSFGPQGRILVRNLENHLYYWKAI
jgi:hypothetical protein